MRIVFIFSLSDSVFLVRALYEISSWLREFKKIDIIFYIPNSSKFRQFSDEQYIRWLRDDLIVNDIPEADIIISSNLNLLDILSNLGRGELIYLNDEYSETKYKQINLSYPGFGIPEGFFTDNGKKKKKIVIGGNQPGKSDLEKIFMAIEKAAPSFFVDEAVILSSHSVKIESSIDYCFLSADEIDFKQLFSEAFYLFWLDKGNDRNFPIIPLWAMASEVIVIGIGPGNSEFEYPVKIDKFEVMELALEIIKIYKMGQYRNNLLIKSREYTRKSRMEIVAEDWYKYMVNVLNKNNKNEQLIKKNNDNESYLIDFIIEHNKNLEQTRNCIKNIEKHTDMSYRLIIINNDTNRIDSLLELGEEIVIIENNEKIDLLTTINKGILSGNGQYIIILKNYIEIPQGSLQPLIDIAEAEEVAVVGPQVIDSNGDPLNCKLREMDKLQGVSLFENRESSTNFWDISTDCFLIKRELLSVIGPIDEEHLFYFKELDYFFRALEKGYKVVYCPDSLVSDIESTKKKGNKINRKTDNHINKAFVKKWSDIIAGSEKRRKPRKVIMAGMTSWNCKTQRLQNFAYNFVKSGYQVLYINPVCGNGSYIQIEEGIFVYTPHGSGTVIYNLKEEREIGIGRGIAKTIYDLEFINSPLILNNPYWLPLLKYLEYSILVYDCFENYIIDDDFKKDLSQERELQIFNIADLVLVRSDKLYQKVKKIHENTYLLKEEVDESGEINCFSSTEKLLKLIHLAYYDLYPGDENISVYDKIKEIGEIERGLLKTSNLEDFIENENTIEGIGVNVEKKYSWLERIKRFFNA